MRVVPVSSIFSNARARSRPGFLAGHFILLLLACVSGARAQLIHTFPSPVDGGTIKGTGYGASVALGNNLVSVGAPEIDGLNRTNTGYFSAHDYAGNPAITGGGVIGQEFSELGRGLAINGDRIYAGGPGFGNPFPPPSGSNRGYIMRTTAYSGSIAFMIPSGLNDGDRFGESVASFGSVIIGGAPGKDAIANDAGLAYIYGTDESFVASLAPGAPFAVAGERYGSAVGAGASLVLVGSPVANVDSQGGVRTFTHSGSYGTHEFLPNANANFGQSVAGGSAGLVAGAPGRQADDGEVIRLDGSTGAVVATLVPPTNLLAGRFGQSVAIGSAYIVIGAPNEAEGAAASAGAVHVFDVADNSYVMRLANPSPDADDRFGAAVATFDEFILVGAPGDDTTAFDAGAAYLFDPTTPVKLSGFEVD